MSGFDYNPLHVSMDGAGGAHYIGVICPICKKQFSRTGQHVWKVRSASGKGNYLYFCSYSCMRRGEREREEQIMKRRKEAACSQE